MLGLRWWCWCGCRDCKAVEGSPEGVAGREASGVGGQAVWSIQAPQVRLGRAGGCCRGCCVAGCRAGCQQVASQVRAGPLLALWGPGLGCWGC